MTSQSVLVDNSFHTAPKRRPVVVRIHEVPLISPTDEPTEGDACGLVEVVGKIENAYLHKSRAMLEGLSLKRPRSGGVHGLKQSSRPSLRRRSSLSSVDGDMSAPEVQPSQTRPTMRLPHFTRTGTQDLVAREYEGKHPGTAKSPSFSDVTTAQPSIHRAPSMPQSWYPSGLISPSSNGHCGIVPPLTPPEDIDFFQWDTSLHAPPQTDPPPGVREVSNARQDNPFGRPHDQPRHNSAPRPSEIQMPERTNISPDDPNRSNWLERACQPLVSTLGDSGSQLQIQMVVQALPSQPKSTLMQPVFEKIVENVQNHFTFPPYITITHAVSQVISMDEVPASPPATPNTNYLSDDYFQDQTIFTHAAVVPAYHSQSNLSTNIGPRPTNIIAAPCSIQISILERYLPPTTAKEANDFFTLSRRSYLADRLLELSSNNGTLLLVYPTQAGGSTFANKYIGPVIEPFLRQFILLNGLYIDIAVELGRMAAVSRMKSFEQIKGLISNMCQELSQRAPSRGLPSRYEIVHAEANEVVLDRALWIDWYIEQEQPRLRQNLVDYHKAGGRMPSRNGQIETTTGMLAREVVEGIRSSRAAAGDAGMEVGVFVIRRTIV